MTQNKSSLIPDIQELQARLEQWRQSRPKRSAIPDELWAAAAALARRDGVNRTAAALRLDGGKLKRKMGTSVAADKKEPPAFVELLAASASGRSEYTFELEGGNGKLRIHCQGTSAAELADLTRALWDVVH
jgi:hypothetical protein